MRGVGLGVRDVVPVGAASDTESELAEASACPATQPDDDADGDTAPDGATGTDLDPQGGAGPRPRSGSGGQPCSRPHSRNGGREPTIAVPLRTRSQSRASQSDVATDADRLLNADAAGMAVTAGGAPEATAGPGPAVVAHTGHGTRSFEARRRLQAGAAQSRARPTGPTPAEAPAGAADGATASGGEAGSAAVGGRG